MIEGVARLNGTRHSVLPDRIETGTYAMAVAMTGGDVLLEKARPELLQSALDVIVQTGAEISVTNDGIRVRRNGAGINPVDVTTEPFPGFPTDLQAQLMALVTTANGTSRITETIFENRFMHVQELARLGARIQLDGETATIEGVEQLDGRAGDGDRPARLGVACDRGARGRGRDHGQSRLSSRSWLRAAGGQARRAAAPRSNALSDSWVARTSSLLLLLLLLLAAPMSEAAGQAVPACSGAQKPAAVAELLFGRKIGDAWR